MSADEIRAIIKGKRIASFDFGMKRIGWAVCDEMHITTSPKGVLYRTEDDFWEMLLAGLVRERVSACIVGIPYRLDSQQSKIIEAIRTFIEELKKRSGLVVLEVDEAFSSRRAVETMIQIGVPKLKRREKERTDEIAAAIILRDFLAEYE